MLDNSLVQILEGSDETKTIQANKNGQWIDIYLQGIAINLCPPNAKLSHVNVVMLYDPNTGLFGWYCFLFNPDTATLSQNKSEISFLLENSYIYLTDDKIIYFKYYPWSTIDYQESTKRYKSLDMAREDFLIFIQNNLNELNKHFDRNWDTKINLTLSKDVSFMFTTRRKKHGTRLVLPYKEIKLIDVAYQNSQWKLTLESADHKQTFITLNDSYQILEVSGYGSVDKEHPDQRVFHFDRID